MRQTFNLALMHRFFHHQYQINPFFPLYIEELTQYIIKQYQLLQNHEFLWLQLANRHLRLISYF
jgi:hypothetical protein